MRDTMVINYNPIYFYNSNGYREPLWYNQDTKQYINIRYAQKTTDWTKLVGNDPSNVHEYKYFPA